MSPLQDRYRCGCTRTLTREETVREAILKLKEGLAGDDLERQVRYAIHLLSDQCRSHADNRSRAEIAAEALR